MATKDQSAVARRLKYAILADTHHHLKKLCEKRDILPMYLFLKTAYKADSQQKPESFLKECRKLHRMLLQYQADNQQYQSLQSLSKQANTNSVIISDETLIQHFMNALNQYQYAGQHQTLPRLKSIIRQLIDDVSLSTCQHLTTGRFSEHFSRMLGQTVASSSTEHYKQRLQEKHSLAALEPIEPSPRNK